MFLKSTKMYICLNDIYIAFSMKDGNLFVYKVGRLVIIIVVKNCMFSLLNRTSISEEMRPPYCAFQSHSKRITDIKFSTFDSLFMLSSGLDHRLVLYNLQTSTELMKLNFDAELTSCALSLSDTFLFCGTNTGRLVKVSLFQAVCILIANIILF
jgi:WD40 repeat protein